MGSDATPAIAILGAGSWGTALGLLIVRSGLRAQLWEPEPARLAEVERARENKTFLPGIKFPSGLTTNADLSALIRSTPHILIAVPSHAFRATVAAIAPHVNKDSVVAWATKGLEP